MALRMGRNSRRWSQWLLLYQAVLLLGVTYVSAQPPYAVNMKDDAPYPITHPKCKDDYGVKIIVNTTMNIEVNRGSQSAPCTGYVQYDIAATGQDSMWAKVCSYGTQTFTQAMARRICYTVGCNFWRENGGTFADGDKQVMLYDCDAYSGDGVSFPDPTGSYPAALFTGDWVESSQGKSCHPRIMAKSNTKAQGNADVPCFEGCDVAAKMDSEATDANKKDYPYLMGNENTTEAECDQDAGSFFAITSIDLDECENGVRMNCKGPFPESCDTKMACGPNTKCTNTMGSWMCECMDGYEAEEANRYDLATGCTDTDECASVSTNDCRATELCVNIPGSYICQKICPMGHYWHSVNKKCMADVDECADDPEMCGFRGQCLNTVGSYKCACLFAEHWDETTGKCKKPECTETPPTIKNSKYTSYDATRDYGYDDRISYICEDGYKVKGNYYWGSAFGEDFHKNSAIKELDKDMAFELQCSLKGTWQPNPHPTCEKPKCPRPMEILNTVREGREDSYDYGAEVTYTCMRGYHTDKGARYDTFTIQCMDNGKWSDEGYCRDVNECDQLNQCEDKYCINTVGSYYCSCMPLYAFDEKCPSGEIDVCAIMMQVGGCGDGTCKAQKGKAMCECPSGYSGIHCEYAMWSTPMVLATVSTIGLGLLVFVMLAQLRNRLMAGRSRSIVKSPGPATSVYGKFGSPIMRRPFF